MLRDGFAYITSHLSFGLEDLFFPRGKISEMVGVLGPRLYSHIIMVSLNSFVFHIMLLFPFILMADVWTDCHSYHIHDR